MGVLLYLVFYFFHPLSTVLLVCLFCILPWRSICIANLLNLFSSNFCLVSHGVHPSHLTPLSPKDGNQAASISPHHSEQPWTRPLRDLVRISPGESTGCRDTGSPGILSFAMWPSGLGSPITSTGFAGGSHVPTSPPAIGITQLLILATLTHCQVTSPLLYFTFLWFLITLSILFAWWPSGSPLL